jgi:uncharacterized protein (TIGR02265 family)
VAHDVTGGDVKAMSGVPSERVVFNSTIEGLVRALGADLTPALSAKLKAAGLDLSKPLPPGWEPARVHGWLELVATEVSPDLSRDEALRRLGRRFIEGWRSTLLGGAAAGVMKVLGSRRALQRVGRAFRTGDNFTDSVVDFVGPTEAVITVTGQPFPAYVQGILEAGAAMVGVEGVVVIEDVKGEVVKLRMTWRE